MKTTMGVERLWRLSGVVLLCSSLLASCSSVNASWYSEPEWKYRESSWGQVQARLEVDGVRHIMWSETDPERVTFGPLFLPVWPVGAEGEDLTTITMRWAIELPAGGSGGTSNGKPGEVSGWTVDLSRTKLHMDGDRELLPTSVQVRELEDGLAGSFRNYLSPHGGKSLPTAYPVPRSLVFELSYEERYATNEWHELRPVLLHNGVPVKLPVVRFEPERNHDFEFDAFPFYFMGPR